MTVLPVVPSLTVWIFLQRFVAGFKNFPSGQVLVVLDVLFEELLEEEPPEEALLELEVVDSLILLQRFVSSFKK